MINPKTNPLEALHRVSNIIALAERILSLGLHEGLRNKNESFELSRDAIEGLCGTLDEGKYLVDTVFDKIVQDAFKKEAPNPK